MIDITKQYTTRDGMPVGLLCTDGTLAVEAWDAATKEEDV